MKRRFIPLCIAAAAISLLSTAPAIAAESPSVGVVNFTTCISNSKLGKQEQSAFESLKKQMSTLLEDTEKQLNDLAAKFNDPEFVDSLSPEAEEEFKAKFRSLNEDLNRYQNQYYQVLNQSNMKLVQTMHSNVNVASEKIAKSQKLALIVNKDACFFISEALDVTDLVVNEMDKTYDQLAQQQQSANTAPGTQAIAQPDVKVEETEKK
ncbi:MAG TPA: OmpH family outer membrane protein [Rhabdochlamydiaceae bacterium]|jgi:outer membrane protein